MTGFDLETSGTNVFEDRIVTAALVYTAPAQRPRSTTYVIDPGIDIPAEAAAVHGWTRDAVLERVGGEGRAIRVTTRERPIPMTAAEALKDLADRVANTMHLEHPLVVANAAYDLSLLNNELQRHDALPLAYGGVVDPMVLEKAYDKFRRTCYKKAPDGTECDRENSVHVCGGCRGGKHRCGGCGTTDRTLTSLCQHYGIFLGSAHAADADALAAVRLASRLSSLWQGIARVKLATLHRNQVDLRREQQAGLAEFFAKLGEGEKAAEVCGEWPVHTACAPAPVAAGAGVSA